MLRSWFSLPTVVWLVPFSSAVLKEVEQLTKRLQDEGQEVVYYLVGRKGRCLLQVPSTRSLINQWTGGTDVPSLWKLPPRGCIEEITR